MVSGKSSMEVMASTTTASYSTLRWVSTTPLGSPVVPEVYIMPTGSSGRICFQRCSNRLGLSASRSRPMASTAL